MTATLTYRQRRDERVAGGKKAKARRDDAKEAIKEQRIVEVTGMLSVPVIDKTGAQTGTIEVDAAEFGGKISKQLLHESVLMFLANQRAGTHHTLRRGEVAGSSKKLFRQKGTGNARAGTKRTNKRRGGGTAKGPKPRDYEYHLPKKAVKAATRMAILSKLRDGEVLVIDGFEMAAPKTKEVRTLFKTIKVGKKMVKKTVANVENTVEVDVTLLDSTVLIGTATYDENIYKSARNLETVSILPTAEFNAYTVLKRKRLVLTKAALEALRQPKSDEKAAEETK